MDSCGALDEMGRRSEEELGGGEALDNMHGSTAERTLPRRLNGLRGRGGVCCWLIGWLEQVETLWEKLRSPSVSEKSEVADTHKAMRQQVQEKASQELIDGQSHQALFVVVSGVAAAKRYVVIRESNQPAVGDGLAVGVCAEIAQYMFWPAERLFGVDDPVVTEQ